VTGFADVIDVTAMLTPPEVMHAALVMPHDWLVWDTLFQRVRDGINLLLGIADHLPGVAVPRLPDGSLADLIVKPLCGDWDRIRSNGDACRILARGMDGLAQNLAAVPISLAPHWTG